MQLIKPSFVTTGDQEFHIGEEGQSVISPLSSDSASILGGWGVMSSIVSVEISLDGEEVKPPLQPPQTQQTGDSVSPLPASCASSLLFFTSLILICKKGPGNFRGLSNKAGIIFTNPHFVRLCHDTF